MFGFVKSKPIALIKVGQRFYSIQQYGLKALVPCGWRTDASQTPPPQRISRKRTSHIRDMVSRLDLSALTPQFNCTTRYSRHSTVRES